MASNKTAFVIMPFSPTQSEQNWTEIFENVFYPALTECGYTCSRAKTSTGNLITSIVESVLNSDLVLADVTDRNANVFYELGVRHSLRRGTIIVSQGTDHVPSDLKGYWFLQYGLRPADVKKFKEDIRKLVEAHEANPDRSDSPVSDFLDQANISSSRQINKDNLKKLGAILTELSGNVLAIQQRWSTGKPQMFSVGCINLLLQTRYVDIGPDLLKDCYELEYHLEILKAGKKVPGEMLLRTLEETEAVFKKILTVRDSVAKGDFVEPASVSSMIWSPQESVLGNTLNSRFEHAKACENSSASAFLASFAIKRKLRKKT